MNRPLTETVWLPVEETSPPEDQQARGYRSKTGDDVRALSATDRTWMDTRAEASTGS